MKIFRKILALAVGAALLCSSVALLAGCAASGMTWYSDNYISIGEDSVVSQAIKTKTGLDITFDTSVSSSTDRLSLMISSGDLPDILTMSASDSRYKQLAQEGKLWSLDELCEQYGVEIAVGDNIRYNYAVEGDLYGLPNYFYTTDENTTLETNGGMLIRKDWFEAYMEYVIDNDLTEVDADKNGICDYDITSAEGAVTAARWVYNNVVPAAQKASYYGMLLDPFVPSTSYQGVAWMCQYFGVRYEDAEGNYVDGAETQQFKQVVKFLNTLYNNDTLHPGEPKMLPQAVLTNTTTEQVGAVLARGDAFMFCGTPQNYPSYFAAGRYPADSSVEPVEYVAFVIKNNEREDPYLGDIAGSGYLITCIPKTCADPEAAIRALAYLWSDEGQELCAYGVRGNADESGNITSVYDADLAETVSKDDVTYYIDAEGQYHYTQNYLDVLGSGDEEAADRLGVAEWMQLYRPSYINSLNWGVKQTNKESAYINNLKKPLSMYSVSYAGCSGLIDVTFDYAAAGVNTTYSELVSINTKVSARWADMVTGTIAAGSYDLSMTYLDDCIQTLNKIGHDVLYEAMTARFKARKADMGIDHAYGLNDPNYVKKEISEGGRATWEHNGKTYTDIWGARGDLNYYEKYDIVG